jgi:ATP-dependent 26S proteasome regulatory subunit
LAILATNFRNNIDKAFLRRVNGIVQFPAPGIEERLKLWSQSISSQTPPDQTVQLEDIARNFSLTGANIMNVVRYASIMTLKEGRRTIAQTDILEGIRREMAKEQSLAATGT